MHNSLHYMGQLTICAPKRKHAASGFRLSLTFAFQIVHGDPVCNDFQDQNRSVNIQVIDTCNIYFLQIYEEYIHSFK